jgi:hypothetical protein
MSRRTTSPPVKERTDERVSVPLLVKSFFLVILALASSGTLFAQAEKPGSATPPGRTKQDSPASRSPAKQPGSAARQDSSVSQAQLERLTKAADKVLNRIQAEENDLYLRVNYFEKPSRLDPNSYASREEVAQWQGTLQQLKEKHDLVTRLYADLGKDLDAELKSTSASEELISQFKKLVMDGFPWDEIEKKRKLIADFIDEEGKLLLFYDKNWGSWTPSVDPDKPEFNSASAASIYKRLRDQILSTSEQIEKEYKAMSE